jgi:hypothetical protein
MKRCRVEVEQTRGIDHRFCDTHRRTEIAISDAEVHYELVFDSRQEYEPFMFAMDDARYAAGKPSII